MLKGTRSSLQNYLIRQLPCPTAFLNKKLEVVYASDSFLETFEMDRKTVIGTSLLDWIADTPDHWMDLLNKCLKGAEGQRGTDRIINPQQKEYWFEYVNNPWYDEQENVVGLLIQVTDISHRVREEIELEKTRLLLKTKSELARIGSWEYDVASDTLQWSHMTRAIHEVSEDFVPTLESAIDFYKKGYSRNTISMAVYRSIDTGEPWTEKLELITASGKSLWVIASGKPLYKEGEYIGLIGTIQDVTQMSLSEEKTRESEALLRTVVDNLPLNVYIKDLESRKVLVNRAEWEFLGAQSPGEVIGKDDSQFQEPGAARQSREEDLYVMQHGKSILRRETLAVLKDGSTTNFLSSKIPLRDSEGEINGLLGISMDISELKQKEQELRTLIDMTSKQNKQLVNFAHIVSHNLRSHAANFSMLLDLLQHEQKPEEAQRIQEMLQRASRDLMETLENLNEVVALNTRVREVEMVPVAPAGVLDTLLEGMESILQGEAALVVNEIDPEVRISADASYLESIFTNFITNAVKYKHPDRDPVIRFSACADQNGVVLEVSDNGSGIDLEKYGDKLFGMYKTFHDHPQAKGIGLYITKNQVEAMNAHIEVQSQVGQGTTFKIHFHVNL